MPLVRRRPLLRAAAVGGGAYALGKRNARVQEEQNDRAYQEGQQAVAAAPAPAAPAPTGGSISAEDTARLAELGKLHDQGILTDAEFSQEKAKILGL